jgi:uncharacterized protein YndB with AHSA1/START domain
MPSDAATTDGILERADGGSRIRFERILPHPPEAVWDALTRPERLEEWLGRAALQPERGGSFQLRWDETGAVMHGTVTAVEEPSVFAYSGDPHGDVRFELGAEDGGCRLGLVNDLPSTIRPEAGLATWHLHLDALAAALDGRPEPWDRDRWEELRRRYAG